ncbi:hypothetical protein ACIBCH_09865 [Amycolatopsis thailandensis]|uniref:hypothetical protein n=1 Tax=Amycolatopsis thailandensis TaxID=589330 RepID=UPI0037B5E736
MTDPAIPPTPEPPHGEPAPATNPPAPEAPKPEPPTVKTDEIDWKAEARKWEERSKENFKELEKLKPLERLAAALGDGEPEKGKTELEQITERLAKHEEELGKANLARWRAEIANAKQLTPEQAAELRGETAEELSAHADRLLTLFPTVPAAPGTPRPDPSQGGQGGNGVNLDSQIAEAQKAGDFRRVIALQRQKLVQPN